MSVTVEDAVRAIRDGDKVELVKYLDQGVDPNDRNKLGWTLLHITCLEGRSDIAQILLDRGASVNACTTDMSTPLHRAAGHGNVESTQVLINKGAYINAQDKYGNTPLHEAAKYLHTKTIKLLIEKKADKTRLNNKKQNFTDMVGQQLMPVVESGDVDTLLIWLNWKLSPSTFGNLNWSILHHASARGQINIASLLLERGANVNAPDSNKSSALHAACFHGNKRIVELLIGKGANVNAKDQMGNTPLHSAISGAHPDIINILLESGCDTKIPNSEGQIFTHLRLLQQVNEFLIDAVENKRVAHVSSLLKGQANPDTKDSAGCPVLCVATFKGDLLIADALLAAGANPNLPSEDNIKTPLHYASIWGHFFILKSLLDKGASVLAKDRVNKTPLHEAARGGFEDVVTVLVGRCSPMDAQDDDGNTPLHEAARWGHTNVADMLQEKGADDSIKNNDRHTHLDLALMRAVRTEDKAQVMSCLAWGGDPNTTDGKGWSLLHHASYKGAADVCRLLIDSEADINVVDKENRTPLLLAAYRGNQEITQDLLDSGADVNMKDNQHNTPLHWAAAEGSVATVELLIQMSANRNIRNKEGKLYTELLLKHLYFAVRHNDLEKVQSLLRAGADQTAIVRGTNTTPRDEAKRRKNFGILRQMLSQAPKKKVQEDAMAIEYIFKLFEPQKGYDSSSEDDISSNPSDDEISDQEAPWKMQNASVIVKEKDIVEEETKSFWEYWEEKPTIISVKDWCKDDLDNLWEYWEEKPQVITANEFFKEEVPWWQNGNESCSDSEENEISDRENYVVISFQDVKKKWGDVISAKELFKEDECWWRDAVKELYSSDEEDTERGHKVLSMEAAKRKWGSVIPAKEFFREDECWWRDAVEEVSSSSEEDSLVAEIPIPTMTEIKKEWSNVISAQDVIDTSDKVCNDITILPNSSICKPDEEDAEPHSVDDDTNTSTDYKDWEISTTSDSWEEANDSFPSNSTMYSVSDGKIFVSECPSCDDDSVSDESSSYDTDSDTTSSSHATEKDIDSDEISSCSSVLNLFDISTINDVSPDDNFHDGTCTISTDWSVELNSEEEADDIEEDTEIESKQIKFPLQPIVSADSLKEVITDNVSLNRSDSLEVNISLQLPKKNKDPVITTKSNNITEELPNTPIENDDIPESSFTFYIKPLEDPENKSEILNSLIRYEDDLQKVPDIYPLKKTEGMSNSSLAPLHIKMPAQVETCLNSFFDTTEKLCISNLNNMCKELELPEENNFVGDHLTNGEAVPQFDRFLLETESVIHDKEPTGILNETNVMVSDSTSLISYPALTDYYDGLDDRVSHGKVDTNIASAHQVDGSHIEKHNKLSSIISNNTDSKLKGAKMRFGTKNIVSEMDTCLAKVDASLTLLQSELSKDFNLPHITSTHFSNPGSLITNSNLSNETKVNNACKSYANLKCENQPIVFTKVNVSVPDYLLSKSNMSDMKGNLSTCFRKKPTISEDHKEERYICNMSDGDCLGKKLHNPLDNKIEEDLKFNFNDKIMRTEEKNHVSSRSASTGQQLHNESNKISLDNLDKTSTLRDGYSNLRNNFNYIELVDNVKATNLEFSTLLTKRNATLTDATSNPVCKKLTPKISNKINEITFCDTGMSVSCPVAQMTEDDQPFDIISPTSDEDNVAVHTNQKASSSLRLVIEAAIFLIAVSYIIIQTLISFVGIVLNGKME